MDSKEQDEIEKANELILDFNKWIKERQSRSYYNPMPDKFKSMRYVRYADDFILIVIVI